MRQHNLSPFLKETKKQGRNHDFLLTILLSNKSWMLTTKAIGTVSPKIVFKWIFKR